MEKKVYVFSGLGADERVFQKLNFSEFSPTFIKWTTPAKDETLEEYAKSLLRQIDSERPILIGLSFGGMMAMEVAKHIATEKIIVIASAKTKNEIPFYYRLAGKLKLHRLIPKKGVTQTNFITDWFFGAESDADKILLKQILLDTDPVFLKWAIDKLANWNNTTVPKNTIHIHGTSDHVLPYTFVSSTITIKNGGHFMTLNKAEELNKILKQVL